MMEVRKLVKEWKNWNKEKETAKSEIEIRKLVPKYFHKWIQIFGKKASEQIPTRKL